ncbi:hypothetical protein ABTX61_09150 [Amycolatopsis japonica]|uniref:hypothetical protein n=1 Tax=Amycolatopsis japonica TaxID=208439 RepID=UPI0033244490
MLKLMKRKVVAAGLVGAAALGMNVFLAESADAAGSHAYINMQVCTSKTRTISIGPGDGSSVGPRLRPGKVTCTRVPVPNEPALSYVQVFNDTGWRIGTVAYEKQYLYKFIATNDGKFRLERFVRRVPR